MKPILCLLFALSVSMINPSLATAQDLFGGEGPGCVQYGDIAVVTVDRLVNDRIGALRHAYSLYKGGCLKGDAPEIVVMYKNDRDIKIGKFYDYLTDPETSRPVGVATISHLNELQTFQRLAPFRAFTVLSHEVTHNWVRTNHFPRPLVTKGKTTDAGEPGVLVDTTATFTGHVWPGDQVELASGKICFVAEVETHQLFLSPSIAVRGGMRYTVTADDLSGIANAHWAAEVDLDGGLLDGRDWVDRGDGLFGRAGRETTFGDYNLYMMGFKPFEELKSIFVIKDYEKAGRRLATGTRRDYTPEQVFWNQSYEFNPRNLRIRFVVVTTQGKPVRRSQLEKLDQARRDWITHFQLETSGRGTVSTVLAEDKPDLVVADIEPPETVEIGKPFVVNALVHNQSEAAVTQSFTVALETPGTAAPIIVEAEILGMEAHELANVPLEITIDSEDIVDGGYGGSLDVRVIVDAADTIAEADEAHNDRLVGVPWTAALTPTATLQTGATYRVCVSGSDVYAAREAKPFDGAFWLERVSFKNPEAPETLHVREVPAEPRHLAADRYHLAVAYDDGIEVYDLPLTSTSAPPHWLPILGPQALAYNKGRLYAAHVLGGFHVLVNSVNGGTLRSVRQVSVPTPNLLRGFWTAGTSLYTWASQKIFEFDVSDPENPLLVRDLGPGFGAEVRDFQIDDVRTHDGRLYAVAKNFGLFGIDLKEPEGTSRDVEVLMVENLVDLVTADEGVVFGRQPTTTGGATDDSPTESRRVVSDLDFDRRLAISGGYLLASSGRQDIVVYQLGGENAPVIRQIPSGCMQLDGRLADFVEFQGRVVVAGNSTVRVFDPQGIQGKLLRGDTDGNERLDISDAIDILNVLFGEQDFRRSEEAYDVNEDRRVDISDAIDLLNYLFGE